MMIVNLNGGHGSILIIIIMLNNSHNNNNNIYKQVLPSIHLKAAHKISYNRQQILHLAVVLALVFSE